MIKSEDQGTFDKGNNNQENNFALDLDNSKQRDSVFRVSNTRPHFTETVFQKQKKLVEQRMIEYKNLNLHLQKPNNDDKKKLLLFNDLSNTNNFTQWEWSLFDTIYQNNEEVPLEKLTFNESSLKCNHKGIEVSKLAFRTKEKVKTPGLGVNIDVQFSLKDESSLWVFMRNESSFNTDTVVVRISKDANTQRCFLSLGTYITDINNNNIFKVFHKQQLIDYTKKKSKQYQELDVCDYVLQINDIFEDKISCKIYLNGNTNANEASSNFFLPYHSDAGLMLAGTGRQILLKSVKYSCYDKNEGSAFSSEINSCDCCTIY